LSLEPDFGHSIRGFNYRNTHYNAEKPPRTNTAATVVDGRSVQTLKDLSPESPGLEVLFVGKTPAPESVRIGHYFQGKQG
jgi:hypothetical protein